LDFFLVGYIRSLVYDSPVKIQCDIVARIAVAAGNIRQVPGIFQTVQNNIARR
jgi:hypothetical protein